MLYTKLTLSPHSTILHILQAHVRVGLWQKNILDIDELTYQINGAIFEVNEFYVTNISSGYPKIAN
jgi:hypothetical protein